MMTKTGWIKATEQKPVIGTPVLCVGTHGGVFLVNRCEEVLEDRIWVNGVGWRRFTYWMPLPPAPKEVI